MNNPTEPSEGDGQSADATSQESYLKGCPVTIKLLAGEYASIPVEDIRAVICAPTNIRICSSTAVMTVFMDDAGSFYDCHAASALLLLALKQGGFVDPHALLSKAGLFGDKE